MDTLFLFTARVGRATHIMGNVDTLSSFELHNAHYLNLPTQIMDSIFYGLVRLQSVSLLLDILNIVPNLMMPIGTYYFLSALIT